jgi:hypothetical protein
MVIIVTDVMYIKRWELEVTSAVTRLAKLANIVTINKTLGEYYSKCFVTVGIRIVLPLFEMCLHYEKGS